MNTLAIPLLHSPKRQRLVRAAIKTALSESSPPGSAPRPNKDMMPSISTFCFLTSLPPTGGGRVVFERMRVEVALLTSASAFLVNLPICAISVSSRSHENTRNFSKLLN